MTCDYSQPVSIELSNDDGESESRSPRRMDGQCQSVGSNSFSDVLKYFYHINWTEKKSLVVWQFVVEIKDVYIVGRGW